MYKVNKIRSYQATRDIELINESTGTKDICFDDSLTVSFSNFDFMQVGKTYDCKMVLFGDFDKYKTENSVEVTVIETGVVIGNTSYIKVLINSDVYYIRESDSKGFEMTPKTRKNSACS